MRWSSGAGHRARFLRELLSGDSVETATVELTNAQIKALPTTGIEIVAAQGPGKLIVPVITVLHVDTAAGAYTNVSGDASSFARLWYGVNDFASLRTDRGLAGFDLTSVFVNGRVTVFSPMLLVGTSSPPAIVAPDIYAGSDIINEPIVLKVNNTDGDFTGGNAANSMQVVCNYIVVDLS